MFRRDRHVVHTEKTAVTEGDPKQSAEHDKSQTQLKQTLDDQVLEVLGKQLAVEKPLGPSVIDEIASRWTEILKAGLPKEEKPATALK